MLGLRWRRSGLSRPPAIADRFLAGPFLEYPFLQTFGFVAIHDMVEPATFFGAVDPLLLGSCPVTRRILRLRRNGCRYKNRQGNREHWRLHCLLRLSDSLRQREAIAY
jgi:hypothetical protein